MSIFSLLFPIHFLWYWQGEFMKQSKLLRLVIIFFILMFFTNNSIVFLYGKIRCCSMLVKPGTKLFFHSYFCSDVLISSLLFTREQHCSTANYRRYITSCRRNRRWRGRTEGTWIPCTGAWVAGPRSWTSDEDIEVLYLRPSLKPKNSSPKRGFKERTWLRLLWTTRICRWDMIVKLLFQ